MMILVSACVVVALKNHLCHSQDGLRSAQHDHDVEISVLKGGIAHFPAMGVIEYDSTSGASQIPQHPRRRSCRVLHQHATGLGRCGRAANAGPR